MREPRLAQFLLHPITAWRTVLDAQAQRVDQAARDAGLTVEALPRGARRYHDPRLTARRGALLADPAEVGEPTTVDDTYWSVA
jgi:hypothetical protein